MRDNRFPASPCPSCGAVLVGAFDPAGEAVPSPGDMMICEDCQAVGLFGPDLRLRAPTAGELAELMASAAWPDVQRYRHALTRAKGKGRRHR